MQPLETLRHELERHDLPRRYVQRVCAELAAHLDDATDDIAADGVLEETARSIAAARLGCPVELANRLYQRHAEQSLWLRYPLSMVLLLSVAVFLVLGVIQLALLGISSQALSPASLEVHHFLAKATLPLAGAWILHLLLERYLGKRRWLYVGVGTMIALSFTTELRVSVDSSKNTVAVLRLIP